MQSIVFLIECPDRKGLVSHISTFFYERGFNILQCQQYTDIGRDQYFMRVKLDLSTLAMSRKQLEQEFEAFGREYNLTWQVHYTDRMQKMAILVSKASHCLYDLLLRQKEGELACEIPVIISNHPDLEMVADQFRIPFHALPVVKGEKEKQEAEIRRLLKHYHIEVIVLARYMQILSGKMVAAYTGKIINIHHAFLPAFQGAAPYQQAYERGVKMIGATAHYVTEELDEGPIIEQDVERVSHEQNTTDLSRIGKDIERIVLARAVKAHLDHRVILSGRRTVVFSSGG